MRVADQVPRVAADVGGAREAVAAAVARLVVADLDPVGDQAVDAVAARRLAARSRSSATRVRAVAEVELSGSGRGVVGLPDRRVVLRAVGLRDLVVQRAVEAGRARRVRIRVLVRVARVALVPELGQDDEDLVGLLAGELDVLVVGGAGARLARLADLGDLAAVAALDLRVAVDDLLQRRLAQLAPLLLRGVAARRRTPALRLEFAEAPSGGAAPAVETIAARR